MLGLKRRDRRTYGGRKFVPSVLGGLAGARLEGRSLAAPAIWRRPAVDPLSLNDLCHASWGLGSASGVLGAAGGGQHQATFIDPITLDVTQVTMLVSTGAEAVDLENPAAPAAPIGQYAVSFNTFDTIQITASGNEATVQPFLDTAWEVNRNYLLANDGGGQSGPATLQETLTVIFQPGSNADNTGVNVFMNMHGSLVTGTTTVTWDNGGRGADGESISTVTINGEGISRDVWDPGTTTGTINTPNGSVDYAWNDNQLTVIATPNLGTLPAATRNPDGTVNGNPWGASLYGQLQIQAQTAGGGTRDVTYSAHFDALIV
jgi:hypothetical protein